MRELTLEEMDLITGGADTIDGITVIGDGGSDGWDGWDGWWDGGYDGGYDGGGGGGGDPPPDPPPEPLPPCVAVSPANVNSGDLLNAARSASAAIAAGNDEHYEYGTLIYELNGTVGYGTIQTQNNPGQVDISTQGVPDGARIVGYLHNHPDQWGIDDRVPSDQSGGDWDRYSALVQHGPFARGITADPNMLLFLYSNEDGKLRAYDKTDKNTQTPSCAI